MNIVYIGSSGVLSVAPLRFMLLAGWRPAAVAVAADSASSLQSLDTPIIAGANESVEMLAVMNRLPVIRLFTGTADSIEELKACKPDVIIVSCLPHKLPEDMLTLAEYGCFNLHPSLLPAFRGPVPLFWQFREAVKNFGISLHRMTSRIDAGPVVAQRSANMPDGVSNREANDILAALGVELLEGFLDDLARGEAVTESFQDESLASSMGFPRSVDFDVDPAWPARRIYNFMRATRHWGQNYRCAVAGRSYALVHALSYRLGAAASDTVVISGNRIVIPCHDSTLTASFRRDG